MKRLFKAITLILSISLLCPVLTGCDALDEMRSQHAFINDDGSISYNGSVYLPLDTHDNPGFCPKSEGLVTVTETDVPVLLSEAFSTLNGGITADGTIMSVNADYWFDGMEGNEYYCRSDRLDEINAMLAEEAVAVVYCYDYCFFDENGIESDETYILTETQRAVLDGVLNTQAEERIDVNVWENSYVQIYARSEDGLFNYDIANVFYIDGAYVVEDYEDDVTREVPEEFVPVFDGIMEMQFKAEEYLEQ